MRDTFLAELNQDGDQRPGPREGVWDPVLSVTRSGLLPTRGCHSSMGRLSEEDSEFEATVNLRIAWVP